MNGLIEYIVGGLVDYPDEVTVDLDKDGDVDVYEVEVHEVQEVAQDEVHEVEVAQDELPELARLMREQMVQRPKKGRLVTCDEPNLDRLEMFLIQAFENNNLDRMQLMRSPPGGLTTSTIEVRCLVCQRPISHVEGIPIHVHNTHNRAPTLAMINLMNHVHMLKRGRS